MAQEIASLFVRLGLQDREFRRGIQNTSGQLKTIDTGVTKLGKSLSIMGGLAVAAFAGWGISRVIGEIHELMEASGRQEKAVRGMEQAMRSMGRYSPVLHKKLIETAKGLQDITTFGDEATIEGQKFLLTYKNIGDDVLPRASKTMLDLASLMRGDVRQAANALGKASLGLTGELTRIGISVKRSTYEAEGFKGVLREIEEQVSGQAEAMARTGYGGLEQLRDQISDLKEKLGDLIFIKFGDTIKGWKEKLIGVNAELGKMVERAEINKMVSDMTENMRKAKDETNGWAAALNALSRAWDRFQRGRRLAREQPGQYGAVIRENVYRDFLEQMELSAGAGLAAMKPLPAPGGPVPTVTGKIEPLDIKVYEEAYKESVDNMTREQQKFHDGVLTQQNELAEAQAQLDLERMEEEERQRQERLQAEKELNDKLVREQERFYERIHDISADFIYRILDNQIQSWKDAWDFIFDYVKRIIAEMIAYAIARPIVVPVIASIAGGLGLGALIPPGIGGVGGTMNLAGLAGIGGALSTPLWGGAAANMPAHMAAKAGLTAGPTLGGVLGAAGLGYLGGNLFGGKGHSGAGGAVGAGLGFAFGGPVGGLIGGLGGSFLGSLIGGEEETPEFIASGHWSEPWKASSGYAHRIHAPSWSTKHGAERETSAAIKSWVEYQRQTTAQYSAQLKQQMAALPKDMAEEMEDVLKRSPLQFKLDAGWRDAEDLAAWLQETQQKYADAIAKHWDRIQNRMERAAKRAGYASVKAWGKAMAAQAEFEAMVKAMKSKAKKVSKGLIAEAFKDALSSGDWKTVEQDLETSIYQTIQEAVIKAFKKTTIIKQALKPLFLTLQEGLTKATKGGVFDAAKFERLMAPEISSLPGRIEALRPIFDLLKDTMAWIGGSLGISTAHRGMVMPAYQRGIDYVPTTQMAILHRGEQVIPSSERRRGATAVNIIVHGSVVAENLPKIISDGLERIRTHRIGRQYTLTNMETVGLNL